VNRSWPPPQVLAAALAVSFAACASQDEKKDAPIVNDLKIRGTHAFSESAIKKKILTAETGWWPFADDHHFDPVEWQSDLARIERFYHSRGYYQARVENVRVQTVPPKKQGQPAKVNLQVDVVEGPPVRVGKLQVTGLEPLTEAERETVTADLPLAEKEIFDEGDWDATKARVLRGLKDLGHARTQLDGQAVVDVGTQQAQLTIRTAPGARYRFGEIDVRSGVRSGTPPAIHPDWVAEQVRLAIGDDRVYSEALLDEAQRRVFTMGVFSTGRVRAVGQPTPDGRIPVQVNVREAPMHTLRLGGGVGFDQVRQEARLTGEWTNRNWLGGMRRLNLRATAGWAFLPSTIAVVRDQIEKGPHHGFIYKAGVDFEQPRLFQRPSLRGKTLLESERTLEQTYDAIGGRAMAGVSWEPHSTLTLFPAYNLQGYYLNGPPDATIQSAPLALGCTEDPCFTLLSYLEEIITWDKRDDRLEPRKGHYLSLSLQEGGGPLGGDFGYLRILPEARGYLTLGNDDQFTLAGRLRAGTLLTRSGRPEDSAVTTRFYSGGANAMRGFSIRRLSPLLLVPVDGTGESITYLALPIGGNGLMEGSAEIRTRFTDTLAVATFLDFGTVTRERLPFQNAHRMLYAVGFGLRFLTPVGPLRLDFGFRLPFGRPPPLLSPTGQEIKYTKSLDFPFMEDGEEDGEGVNDSCFGIGGSDRNTWVNDSLCAFHISIGEAF
jgi:translocation and assembly module TamA